MSGHHHHHEHKPFDLEAWLSNEPERERQFPVVGNQVFLAHAGVSPLPMAAHLAIIRESAGCTTMQQETDYRIKLAQARHAAGELFGLQDEEISLIGPTSVGLSLVALGLDWKSGDEVIYYPGDYPANVHPWLALREKGVVLVPLRPTTPGRLTPDMVAAVITPRTRLVALASAHFATGWKLDVNGVGTVAHQAGALFCLDAIQTLGAIRTPLDQVDFVAADSHKWMLGPLAAGVFAVRGAAREQLRPALLGADNVVAKHYLAAKELTYRDGGFKYEPGTMNMLGIMGMKASLDLLGRVGLEVVEKRVLSLAERMRSGCLALGYEPAIDSDIPCPTGIVSVRREGAEHTKILLGLDKAGVVASVRKTEDGRDWLRFAPHFYNTEREIDRALDALAAIVRETTG